MIAIDAAHKIGAVSLEDKFTHVLRTTFPAIPDDILVPGTGRVKNHSQGAPR